MLAEISWALDRIEGRLDSYLLTTTKPPGQPRTPLANLHAGPRVHRSGVGMNRKSLLCIGTSPEAHFEARLDRLLALTIGTGVDCEATRRAGHSLSLQLHTTPTNNNFNTRN